MFLDQKNKLTQLKNEYLEIYSDRNKTLSTEEYLNKIRPYLKDKNHFKKSDTWKIQLRLANNFISSIDNDEEGVMRLKSDSIEIMTENEANKVRENVFISVKTRYQNNLE